MDFEAIKAPLAVFLVGLVLLATGWLFYWMLTRNNAASAKRLGIQTYLLGRSALFLLALAVMIGVIGYIFKSK
jgi:hypothetical protein